MSVTIYGVAKAAGVSIATVSRVINELPGVKPNTRMKVLRAVEELQYEHNPTAVALATGKNKVIGLMLPNIRNPFYTEIAEGIYNVAMNKGVNVITLSMQEQDNFDAGLNMLSRYSVDGLLAMDIPKELLGGITGLVEHVVLVGNDYLDGKTNCIAVDNFAGVQMMMRHLFDAAHRSIALLSEPPVYNDIKDRIRAYHFCMDEEGFAAARHVEYAEGSGIAAGEEAGRKWLKDGLRHSAVLVSNDMLAIGFMKALKAVGKRVPEDVSVAGFDGTWIASVVDPTLSSVVQPMFEMGSTAISLLLDIMQSSPLPPRKIVLSPTLQIGGTTSTVKAFAKP
ncbi:MAG: LacI family transcriptional regulator [Cohnella sp.]|nr:LacI family transcriptional regulator [Cohnella sp.]